MASHSLYELCYSSDPKVDRESGVIRGVKILGRESRNGRTYSDRALSEAAKLYDGVKVNVDHNRDPKAERGFAEGFGELRGIAIQGDGVYGDLHFLKSHALADQVAESAERFPRKFGLSHNAEGEMSKSKGKWTVESVASVESVDIVGKPATNEGIFESEEVKTMKLTDAIKGLPESEAKTKLAKLFEGSEAEVSEGTTEWLAKIAEGMTPEPKKEEPPVESGSQDDGGENELREEIDQLKAELANERAVNLLESKGIEPKPAFVAAYLAATEDDRKELLEGFPKKAVEVKEERKRPAVSRPLNESKKAEGDVAKTRWQESLERAKKKISA